MKSTVNQSLPTQSESYLINLKRWYTKFEKEISAPICIDNTINLDNLSSSSEYLLNLLKNVNLILSELAANKRICKELMTLIGLFIGCELRLKLKLASVYMCLQINNTNKADWISKAQQLNEEVRIRLNNCPREVPPSIRESAKTKCDKQFIDIADTLKFSSILAIGKIMQEMSLTTNLAKRGERFTEAINVAKQDGDSELIFSLLMQRWLTYSLELEDLARQGSDEIHLRARKALYLKIKENHQYIAGVTIQFTELSPKIDLQIETLSDYLKRTIETMAMDIFTYRLYKRFKRHYELVIQMQDIMAACNQISGKFWQHQGLFQDTAQQVKQELDIFAILCAKSASEKQYKKQTQKNYQVKFGKALAESPDSKQQSGKIFSGSRNAASAFKAYGHDSNNKKDTSMYRGDLVCIENVAQFSLETLLTQLGMAKKRKCLVGELIAHYNLANLYRSEGCEFLKENAFAKAIAQFEFARRILIEDIEEAGCNYDMKKLSVADRARSEQVYARAAIILEEIIKLIELLSRKPPLLNKLEPFTNNTSSFERRASLNSFFEPANREARKIRRLGYGRLHNDIINPTNLERVGYETKCSLDKQDIPSPSNSDCELSLCNSFFEPKKLKEGEIKQFMAPGCHLGCLTDRKLLMPMVAPANQK